MTRRLATAALVGSLGSVHPGLGEPPRRAGSWPLWESYARRFLSEEGRVIDFDANQITTSEGQSYAAFFALVANDRPRFDRILTWTEQNLAGGKLGENLPAWLWGRDDAGQWRVLDANSAADSDLWFTYVLLEAGRLWNDSALTGRGLALAAAAARREVRRLPGLGAMLLPGPEGFEPSPGVYQLNPSYLPLQVLLRVADLTPNLPWGRVARETPAVLEGASRHGFILDWVAYWQDGGFRDAPLPRPEAKGSYDAIRTYLWAGMLHPRTERRGQILATMSGMKTYLQKHQVPPAEVLADGRVADPNGGAGFSAALLPYLFALGESRQLEAQRRRVEGAFVTESGLYEEPPRYYHQNLILFGLGWLEDRFRFGPRGALNAQEVS